MFGWLGVLIGIVFILIGGFLIILFPQAIQHQPEQMGKTGIVLGFILVIVGGLLIFY